MSNFSTKWEFFIKVLIEKGAYKQVLDGLKCTLIIAVCGLLIGVAIGTLIAVVKILPEKLKVAAVFKKAADIYVAFFRGTPMVVQLLLGYYVLLPLLEIRTTPLVACVVIFGLNSGAYVSEIMRGGILSVDPGQLEGGRSVGMSYATTMFKIVIPQAIKNILPTLGNEFITLVKETSIVSFVGAMDLYKVFNDIGTNNYEFMVPYLVMAVIYIIIVCLITLGIKFMERRLRKSDRRS